MKENKVYLTWLLSTWNEAYHQRQKTITSEVVPQGDQVLLKIVATSSQAKCVDQDEAPYLDEVAISGNHHKPSDCSSITLISELLLEVVWD